MGVTKPKRRFKNFKGKGRRRQGGCKDLRGCGSVRCERCGLPVRDHRIDIPCPFWDQDVEYWKAGS